MPKTKSNKYFIAKLNEVKRGSPFRIFRRCTSRLGLRIDEMCMRNGGKRMNTVCQKVGEFFGS